MNKTSLIHNLNHCLTGKGIVMYIKFQPSHCKCKYCSPIRETLVKKGAKEFAVDKFLGVVAPQTGISPKRHNELAIAQLEKLRERETNPTEVAINLMQHDFYLSQNNLTAQTTKNPKNKLQKFFKICSGLKNLII